MVWNRVLFVALPVSSLVSPPFLCPLKSLPYVRRSPPQIYGINAATSLNGPRPILVGR